MRCVDIAAMECETGFKELLLNITAIRRTFLTICVSVTSCERGFSEQKLVKENYARSQMIDVRQSNECLHNNNVAFIT